MAKHYFYVIGYKGITLFIFTLIDVVVSFDIVLLRNFLC